MRYMSLWHPKNAVPSDEQMAQMQQFIDATRKSGLLVSVGGWLRDSPSTCVLNSGGHVSVVDAPYTGDTDAVCGYAIYEVSSREQALELSRRFVKIAGEGVTELHELQPIS